MIADENEYIAASVFHSPRLRDWLFELKFMEESTKDVDAIDRSWDGNLQQVWQSAFSEASEVDRFF